MKGRYQLVFFFLSIFFFLLASPDNAPQLGGRVRFCLLRGAFHVIVAKQSALGFAGDGIGRRRASLGSQICHCAVAQAGICMKRVTSGSVNNLEEMDADLESSQRLFALISCERKSSRDQHL